MRWCTKFGLGLGLGYEGCLLCTGGHAFGEYGEGMDG
jgi:hypothetical protein